MMMARSCNPGVGIERRDTMNPSLWTPTYIKKKLLSSPSCGAMEKIFSANPSQQKTGDPMQRTLWGIRFFRSRPAGGGVCSRKSSLPFANARQLPGGNHPNGIPLGSAALRPPSTQGPALSIQKLLLHMGPNHCKRKIAKMKIFGREVTCSILLSRRLEL
jgi:hypothetical protein